MAANYRLLKMVCHRRKDDADVLKPNAMTHFLIAFHHCGTSPTEWKHKSKKNQLLLSALVE